MEHGIDLIGYMEGSLSSEERDNVRTHLEACPECLHELTLLRASDRLMADLLMKQPEALELVEIEHSMPPLESWEPLPDDLKRRLGPSDDPLRERLRKAILLLKEKGEKDVSDLVGHVDELVEQLLSGPQEPVPSYALERDITLPSQTDLELRMPDPAVDLEMELAGYTIRLEHVPGGTRIRVTRQGEPVPGVKIRVGAGTRSEMVLETNDDGEVIAKRIGRR